MNHALTPYYKQIIRRQIATGRFNNESEVIRRRALDTLGQSGVIGAAGQRLQRSATVLKASRSSAANPKAWH